MTSPRTDTEAPAAPPRKKRMKGLIGVNIGNALEWFDWNIYAVFAPFFAAQFFDSTDPVSSLLATFAIFAVGFLMRPIGGWVFGRLADRRGRRLSLAVAIVLAAFGSLMIAVSPTIEQIGVGASVLLLTARLLQGLAHGGETGSAFTYLAEVAPSDRRGRWASTPWLGVGVGTILATSLGATLTSLLTAEQMTQWGWRIPFAIGALIGLYAIYIRIRMDESPAFVKEAVVDKRAGRKELWNAIWLRRREAAIIAGLTLSCVVVFYTWFVLAPNYAVAAFGLDPAAALWVGVLGQCVFVAAILPFGALSDRIGRRPVLLVYAVGFPLLAFPLEWMLGPSLWQLFIPMAISSILIAACCAPVGAVFAELVPARVRATVVGITYATTAAIFGGTAPYLNTWLSSAGARWVFVVYMVALVLVTLLTVVRIPETFKRQLE
jgi:MHS family alpha-ketoglutarate permease-like MFS transporter